MSFSTVFFILILTPSSTKQQQQHAPILQNISVNKSTNEHWLPSLTEGLPKASGLRNREKESTKQISNMTVATSTGMILPHARGFKAKKQSVLKRKPITATKTALVEMNSFKISPEIPFPSTNHVENARMDAKQRSILLESPFDQLSSTGPFDLPSNQPRVTNIPSQMRQPIAQYQAQETYPFLPQMSPFPILPIHIPYPVPVPMMPMPSFQPIGQQFSTESEAEATVTAATISIPTLALPTFPTLTMPPAFQKLIATTKKPKQKKSKYKSKKFDSEENSEDDDRLVNDLRKKFNMGSKKSRNRSISTESDEHVGDSNYGDYQKPTIRKSYENDVNDEDLLRSPLPKYVEEEEELSVNMKNRMGEINEPWMIGYNEHS